ncbi:MAG: rbfA [Chlamydiales bacterium]|jgi:ribosome-binding factor A|nr:rbfA [Chlamydiales bacterium]
MAVPRTHRLNSLLREVLSEVIRKHVRNPHVHELLTITRVEITKDLSFADVYISVIAEADVKQKTLEALQSAAGFIGVNASKVVVLRHFPSLIFKIDEGLENHMRVEHLLYQIREEKNNRPQPSP